MNVNSLGSLADYCRFLAEAVQFPGVVHSTVRVWSDSPYTGTADGEVFFAHGVRLRLREELDFEAGLITSFGYEFYCGDERLCWYDDFPHPNDPTLAETFPHHKHVLPDIRRHRIPAPEISFTKPNLPFLLRELEKMDERPTDLDEPSTSINPLGGGGGRATEV